MLYDVFICHASEDKDSFVRPLAEMLKEQHVEVWYDEFSLTVGDSLRESIDKGLSKSRFGIVVLSNNFFKKKWTQRELNGLVLREINQENKVILPIWHNITINEILEYSPPLADRLAVDSRKGVAAVCKELIKKLRPQESPLIVAQNELYQYGLKPPVVTDEWWLDIVEASNKLPCWGFAIPDESVWGRWTFPLPANKVQGEERGIKLAWTAMQLNWEKQAKINRITQITHPEIVLEFINKQPGLKEMCYDYPYILATYAPQITIKGFSGEFDDIFDSIMSKYKNEFALRSDNLNELKPSSVACNFVQGELGGPSPKAYEIFDYLIWLISDESVWLPKYIRDFLLNGMKDWNVWASSSNNQIKNWDFIDLLYDAKDIRKFKMTKKARVSLLNWITDSINSLGINDKPETILSKFIELGFIEAYISKKSDKSRKKI